MLSWLVIGIGDITTQTRPPRVLAEPRSRLAGIVTRHPAKARALRRPRLGRHSIPLPSPSSGRPRRLRCDPGLPCTPPRSIACLPRRPPRPLRKAHGDELCRSLRHAERLPREYTGRTLGIAYYRRMYPKIDRARRSASSQGVIGRPVFAEATAHDWFTSPSALSRAWLADPAQSAGGGPCRDLASPIAST